MTNYINKTNKGLVEKEHRQKNEENLETPKLKMNLFTLPVTNKLQSQSQQRMTVVADEIEEKSPFQISKVVPVRPIDLSTAAFVFKLIPQIENQFEEDDESSGITSNSINFNLNLNSGTTTITRDDPLDVIHENSEDSVFMEPVMSLPRGSQLLKMDKKSSRDSLTDSTPTAIENLTEAGNGSQKKSRMTIPKPIKSFVSKGRKNEEKKKSEEKKKKEDANNNLSSKAGSRETLDQVSSSGKSNGKKGLGRRQSSVRDTTGFTSYVSSTQKQESKDSGMGKGSRETLAETSSASRASRLSRKQVSVDGDSIRTPSRAEAELLRANSVRTPSRAESELLRANSVRSPPKADAELIRANSEGKPSKEGEVPVVRRRRRNTARIMRDYRLSMNEVKALKCILGKVDLYQEDMRTEILPLLELPLDTIDGKVEDAKEENAEVVSENVVRDAEKDNLKQKLFLSRKELDSYISFTKKMEREKRSIVSDKEELVTKVQWQDRRMTLVESENRALKIERGELLNQIYKLRCPANVPIAERGKLNQRSSKESEYSQSELEVSRQRLIYEADAFAQERAKLIKERHRLDEEVRKVQIRCVSLLAQAQHSEKIIDDLQREKEELKSKLSTSSKELLDDNKKLQEKLRNIETMKIKGVKNEGELNNRVSVLIDHVKDTEDKNAHLKEETSDLEQKLDNLTNENRDLAEEKLKHEYEVLSLQHSIQGLEKAKNEAEVTYGELDTKLHQSQAEIRLYADQINNYQSNKALREGQIEDLSRKIADMQLSEVNLKSDQDSFAKFLEIITIELEEKLGEEAVSQDTEAKSLQEKADLIGKQISAHLTPSRKYKDYDDIKEELDELRQENSAIKFALSSRLEIQSIQKTQVCDCSHEKELLQRELQESRKASERLDDEVKRLHEDKQSLLMSFLNLQAAARSREPSRTGTEDSLSDDGNVSDDESGEEEEEYSEDEDSREESGEDANTRSLGVRIRLSEESEGEESGSEDSDDDRSPNAPSARRRVKGHYSFPNVPLRPAKSLENINLAVDSADDRIVELQHKLRDVTRTKECLEDERVGLLDSLCKQAERVEELRDEIESLKEDAGKMSRDNSLVHGDECPNCAASKAETRQYLGIIERLTEDKLQLEKSLIDVRREKEKLQGDIEHETDQKFTVERELQQVKLDKEEEVKKVEEDMKYLLQNLTNAEDENKNLEAYLQQVRQDKMDMLEELKVAEADKLDLVQSLQYLTNDKVKVEDLLSKAKEEIRRMKKQLRDVLHSGEAEGNGKDIDEETFLQDVM